MKEIYHWHHIIPKHMGGTDDPDNLVRLTLDEHIEAHRELYRVHGEINDLRAVAMLGARLTTEERRLVGKWCYDNGVGMWKDPQIVADGRMKGTHTQMREGLTIFNPDKISEYAAMGGRAGGKKQKELKMGIHDPANFVKNARAGGLAAAAKKYQCGECHMILSAAPLANHQRASGHRGRSLTKPK